MTSIRVNEHLKNIQSIVDSKEFCLALQKLKNAMRCTLRAK